MSGLFDTEITGEDGEVAEMYEFSTTSQVWRYTTYSKQIQLESGLYEPLPISRKRVEKTKNLLKSELEVVLPRDSEIALKFLLKEVEDAVVLSVWQIHVPIPYDKRAIFKGRYTNLESNGSEVSLTFEPITTAMRRLGFRAKYQRSCRHQLYGPMCGASTENHSHSVQVVSVNDTELTVEIVSGGSTTVLTQQYVQLANGEWVPVGGDGYFAAGYVINLDGHRRMIISHTLNKITLVTPFKSIRIGDEITLYAGCRHTFMDCRDQFNNYKNYGGFDLIPKKNPFDGKKIY